MEQVFLLPVGLPEKLSLPNPNLTLEKSKKPDPGFESRLFSAKPVTGMRFTANASGQPVVYERFTAHTKVFQLKNYRYPFPQTKIDVTPKLRQNPGH